MTIVELLRHLDTQGVRLRRTPEGRVGAHAPPGVLTPELVATMRQHRDELAWTVWADANTDDTSWGECTTCGSPMLTSRPGRPCAMTFGCTGLVGAPTETPTKPSSKPKPEQPTLLDGPSS